MAEVFGVGVGVVDSLLKAVLVVRTELVSLGDVEAIGPGQGEKEGAGALFGGRFVFDDLVGISPARARVQRYDLAPGHRMQVV